LSDQGVHSALLRLGLDDSFPSQGSREQVLENYGIDPVSLRKTIADFIRA